MVANASAPRRGEKGYLYDTWEVEKRQITQEAAGYDPYGAKGGKGCASCQWFVPSRDACVLVAGDISPTGNSMFYTPVVVYETPPLLVRIVDKEILTTPAAHKEDTVSQGVLDKIKRIFKGVWSIEPEDGLVAAPTKPFSVYRTKDGDMRFLVVYSNIFKDSHKEIISTEAHEEYEGWVNKTKHYPELQVWHGGPGSAIGKGDAMAFVDGFAVGTGTIYKQHESKATALAEMDSGVSQGFLGVGFKDQPDIYQRYRPFEWTVLPAASASNSWTDYSLKELDVTFRPDQIALFKGVGFTDADLSDMGVKLEEFKNTLIAKGIAYKSAVPDPVVPATIGAPAASIPPPEQAPASVSTAPAAVVTAPVAAGDIASVIKGLLEPRDAALTTLAAAVGDLVAQVKELKAPVEDQLANLLQSKIDGIPGGLVASKSASTIVAAGAVNAQDNPDYNWFFTEAIQPITAAPVGVGAI